MVRIPQYQIVANYLALHRDEEVTEGELVDATGLSQQQVRRAVSKLESGVLLKIVLDSTSSEGRALLREYDRRLARGVDQASRQTS